MIYTPVAGNTSGAFAASAPKWRPAGKTHAFAGTVEQCGGVIETVCGRLLVVQVIYGHESWAKLHAQPHATHETNVCRQCVRKAVPADS